MGSLGRAHRRKKKSPPPDPDPIAHSRPVTPVTASSGRGPQRGSLPLNLTSSFRAAARRYFPLRTEPIVCREVPRPDPASLCRLEFRGKMRAGEEVWWGPDPASIPVTYAVVPSNLLATEVFAADTGPDVGLRLVEDLPIMQGGETGGQNQSGPINTDSFGSGPNWEADYRTKRPPHREFRSISNRKACGIALSLYDRNQATGKVSGDPIADAYVVCARPNNAILALADGVNWGEASRRAARCAIHGAFHYLDSRLFPQNGVCSANAPTQQPITNTMEALHILLEGFSAAHARILAHTTGLTTLCLALALPLANTPPQFAICVVNLGDSFAYLLSKFHGLREITQGSHDTTEHRDLRDAGGALGPARPDGQPELNNMTCSLTLCDPGDILFLTSDGVSDNFDPVVARVALPESPTLAYADEEEEGGTLDPRYNVLIGPSPPEISARNINFTAQLEMTGAERHHYAVKQMERAWHETELDTDQLPSARELCRALTDRVQSSTRERRAVLEDPGLVKESRRLGAAHKDSFRQIVLERLKACPGKLDHATVVAYEVGLYRGDENEVYEATVPLLASPAETEGSDCQ